MPRLTSSQARDTVVFVKEASWTFAPLSFDVEAFHILPSIPYSVQNHGLYSSGHSRIIMDHPVLDSQATRIIRFCPNPLLAASLLIPCRTMGRTVLVAPESQIIQFWTLQQHGSIGSALGSGDQCMAWQYRKGVYFLHYMMVVRLFLMLVIFLIANYCVRTPPPPPSLISNQ